MGLECEFGVWGFGVYAGSCFRGLGLGFRVGFGVLGFGVLALICLWFWALGFVMFRVWAIRGLSLHSMIRKHTQTLNPQTLNPVNPCLEHTVDPPNLHFPSPIPGRVYSLQSRRTTEAKNPIPQHSPRSFVAKDAKGRRRLWYWPKAPSMYVCM